MHKPKRLSDKMKHKRPPADWCGLSNEPRNKNLDSMRGPTSFEKVENDQDKESGPSLLYRFNKHKDRDSSGKKG